MNGGRVRDLLRALRRVDPDATCGEAELVLRQARCLLAIADSDPSRRETTVAAYLHGYVGPGHVRRHRIRRDHGAGECYCEELLANGIPAELTETVCDMMCQLAELERLALPADTEGT